VGVGLCTGRTAAFGAAGAAARTTDYGAQKRHCAPPSPPPSPIDPIFERKLRAQPPPSLDRDTELSLPSSKDRFHLRIAFETSGHAGHLRLDRLATFDITRDVRPLRLHLQPSPEGNELVSTIGRIRAQLGLERHGSDNCPRAPVARFVD